MLTKPGDALLSAGKVDLERELGFRVWNRSHTRPARRGESLPISPSPIAAGFDRWEVHIREGLTRMKARGKLRNDADPAALATATMASIQGGLLLTQVRRDLQQLRIALEAARSTPLVAPDHSPRYSRLLNPFVQPISVF